jgi:hypothetical protein
MFRCKGHNHESYYNDIETYILKLTTFISIVAMVYKTSNICVLIFIVAPCILKIHLLSHTNKCTDYVIYNLNSV